MTISDAVIQGRVCFKIGTKQQEYGFITSWNERFIFVYFDGDKQSKACYPSDLTLLAF